MKSVVYINQDSGYLMVDIINKDSTYATKRILITGRLIERDRKLQSDVCVDYIVKYNRSNSKSRIKSWFIGFFQIYFKLLFKYRNTELFIVSNPPFTILLPLLFRRKFTLYILDVYPDALVNFNVVNKNNYLIKMWEWVNSKVMKRADRIVTLTEGMKSQLGKYCSTSKISVVPVWSPGGEISRVQSKENWFLDKYDLRGTFNIVYSGNFGYTHNLDVVLDLAKALLPFPVKVILIGDGDRKKKLEDRIINENINNCLLLPWQESKNLKFSLSAADLSIVSQDLNISSLSIPSKTFTLLSVGSPILAITKNGSELSQLIKNNRVGMSFEPNELNEMIQFVQSLIENNNLVEEYRNNSLATVGNYDLSIVRLIRNTTL